jgi:hypothetical protein
MPFVPPRIFVSYRRDDVAGDAGRLTDHLKRRFGKRRIFLDIDSINPGIDFVQALDTSLQTTAVMLVVIGPRWTSLVDANGLRRLDAPDDFVVREVAAALRRDIPVVPVLMQGAALPAADDLPPSIAPLATRQKEVIDHSEFHDDVVRLCNRLAPMVGGDRRGRWLRWWPAAALVIALAAGWIGYRTLRTGDVHQPGATAAAPAAAPVTSAPASSVTSPGDSTRTTPVADAPSLPAQAARGASTSGTGRLAASPEVREPSPAVTAAPVTSPAPGDLRRQAEKVVLELQAAERARQVDTLLAEAATQRGRGQVTAAMATLARARELAPDSDTVRRAQAEQAIEWIRNVRFESEIGRPLFVETVTAALAVVDASLAAATGTRRADLLAHAGWANYLLWLNGSLTGIWVPSLSRETDPTGRCREALAIDPENPFANAMLAHWAFRQKRDLPGARRLFDTALRAMRELVYVRNLQWSTFGTQGAPRDEHELVRVADDMRRRGERLNRAQAGTLYSPYSSITRAYSDDKERQALLDVLPPDDHIATVGWALEDYATQTDGVSPRATMRFIVALLHEKAGRADQAVTELRALDQALPSQNTMRQSVQAELARLAPVPPRNRRE